MSTKNIQYVLSCGGNQTISVNANCQKVFLEGNFSLDELTEIITAIKILTEPEEGENERE